MTQDSFSFACGTVREALALPIARRLDPQSSKAAAEQITNSGRREGQLMAVLAIVRKYPHRTSLELSAKSGMDRYVLGRRLPELRKAGLVVMSDFAYICEIGRRPAHRWHALDQSEVIVHEI